jgi:inner membrane protein
MPGTSVSRFETRTSYYKEQPQHSASEVSRMNAAEHRISAALALATAGASLAPTDNDRLPHAAAGCVGGYCLGTLPDLIEPATSPHHRQFFHSLFFAAFLGYGVYKAYRWEPQTPEGKFVRVAGLIAGGAYLVHLALDATTKRSLPAIGRL